MSELPKKPGKYRRAFNWRLKEGQGGTLEEHSGMIRLASSDFPDILEDFLAISRKRQHNPTALARLQLYMLQELLLQESYIKYYRQNLKEAQDAPSSEIQTEDKKIDVNKRQLFFHRMYANAMRAIADGIAWRALDYDRAVMRLLGERETKQVLSSEGTLEELREWSYHFEAGSGVAILNALTNCLAIGDVTVAQADGSVEIVEVKMSKTKSSRKIRQKQAMSEVVSFLSTGEGKNENRDVRIEILPITPETSLDKVEELLNIAGERGWAARRINDYLYVEACDFRKIKKVEELQDLTSGVRKMAIGPWEDRDDFIFDMNTLDVISYTPNCAPFSIFPFRARTCIELLIGAKFYVTYLNLDAVSREFERKGWVIEKDFKTLLEEKSVESALNLRKGPFHCQIPPAEFMRMQIETLRPKTLMDAMEWQLRKGPDGDHGYVLTVYADEKKSWN